MKSNKSTTLLFIGLAAGFALGVTLSEQYLTKVSSIPGWHTTVSPNAMSVQSLLSGLAILALGISLGQFVPFLQTHFTIERMEVLNIGIAVTGSAVCLGMAWDFFEVWYMQILPEQFAFYSRTNALLPLAIVAFGTIATQLLWVNKIRRNSYWTSGISAFIVFGTWLEVVR